MSMADYLSSKAADYTLAELDVIPETILTESGDKNQIVYEADDGTLSIVSLSNTIIFTVTLQWNFVSETESEEIRAFFIDTGKGNGRERTFYWPHPIDGETYTVRFMSPLETVRKANIYGGVEISQMKLRVEGVKP
jgi:hypothetical protein